MNLRVITTASWNLAGLSVTTTTGTVTFRYTEPEDDGTAGVREPRRPRPTPLTPMAAAVDDEAASHA